MKNRSLTQLSATIGDLLVKQLSHELKNFNLYSEFANYYSLIGITDLQEYYTRRAAEEKLHHDWILSYLNDADFKVIYGITEENGIDVSSITEPFDATIKREVETTELIYNIYQKAIEEQDFMTASWLSDKLIKEQIEEESLSRMAASIIELDSDILVKAHNILELLN